MENKTLRRNIVISIAFIIFVVIISSLFIKNTIFTNNNNADPYELKVGNYDLITEDIIKQSTKLLGLPYNFSKKGTKKNVYGTTISGASDLMDAQYMYENKTQTYIDGSDGEKKYLYGIDCSGLIYYALTALGCSTTGFNAQNPVPYDTTNWLTTNGQIKVNNGSYKKVTVLKQNESITANRRYYHRSDGSIIPAGSIVISDAGNAGYNHSWIYLGDLGTSNADVVKEKLKAMGISGEYLDRTLVNGSPVVQSYGNSTHWRIESAGSVGVRINNIDPDSNYNDNGKIIGKIWVFQVANEITGSYNLQIKKTDMNGNALSGAVFKVNNKNYNTNGNTASIASNKIISSLAQQDVYTLTEVTAPSGYTAYSGDIKLTVKFKYDSNSKSYVIDQDATKKGFNAIANDANISFSGNTIIITVKNKIKEGEYNVKVTKVDENDKPINLNKNPFDVTAYTSGFGGNATKLNGTISNNYVKYNNIKISDTQQNNLKITEVEAPDGYNKYGKNIYIKLYKTNDYKINYIECTIEEPYLTTTTWTKLEKNKKISLDGGKVNISLADSTNIEIKVKNTTKKFPGSFSLKLTKIDRKENKLIGEDFQFKVELRDVYQSEANKTYIINSGGITPEIDTTGLKEQNGSINAYLTVDEVKTKQGYIKLQNPIVIHVQFRKDSNGDYIYEYCAINKEYTDKWTQNWEVIYFYGNGAEYNQPGGHTPSGTIIRSDGYKVKYNFILKETNNKQSLKIELEIENNIADLALKKMITKVTKAGTDTPVEVRTENGFNVDRYSGWKIDKSKLSNTTNAVYTMNKTPVEVSVGDKVEYSIKIFNEGEVDAKASQIMDYIPTGLKVVSVKYHNKELTTSTSSTFYMYDEENGVLTINLHDKQYLINAFDGNNLSYDEVLVVCEVQEDATGVLTNVAEITQYTTANASFDKDIDSTAGNWNSPNLDGDNKTTDKSTKRWRNYANANQSLLDGSWHPSFLAQDAGLNGNKGDDDDFDKIKVVKDYKLQLQKVSNESNEQKLSGISFYINTEKSNDTNIRNFLKQTNEDGKTEIITKDITYTSGTDEEDVYYIKEVSIPSELSYSLIDKEFELRIKKQYNSDDCSEYLSEYSFVTSGSQPSYKPVLEETRLTVEDTSENLVTIQVSYNPTDNLFTITIPNNISSSNYELRLIKVTNKTSETDTEKPIQGIKFGINTKQEPIETNANGIIDFDKYEINQNNYQSIDEYVITEIEDTSSRYYTLKEPINIKVQKAMNSTKTSYVVSGISLNNSDFTTSPITREVELKNTNKKVIITLSLEGNLITVKVPNIEKDGYYSVSIKKVDSTGNTLTSQKATTGFTLTGNQEQFIDNQGLVTLLNKHLITADNVNTPDTYTITETTVGDNYAKLKQPINVIVYKTDNGENFVISSAKVASESNSITVQLGKIGTLNNVELVDGSRVSITIDLQTSNEILITVPNNKLQGKYNLEIYKYSEENGKTTDVPGISFFVLKKGTIKASKRTTNSNGIATVSNIEIFEPGTDTYEITEIINDDSKYISLAENIIIKATTTRNTDGTKYILSDVNFENGTKETEVLLENGKTIKATLRINESTDGSGINTIKLNVENPIIKGKYLVELLKKVEKTSSSEPIQNVTFNIRENDADTRTSFTTDSNGKVTIADKNITYENVRFVDKYAIEEIQIDANKYIKLKNPLTLQVSKGKNTTGETGTEDAPGTKFVVTNIALIGQGISTQKRVQGTTSVTLSDIVLEDGSTVDIKASVNEETDNATGEKVQRVTVEIPNKERKGGYSLQIKKVNSSQSNKIIEGATFKVNSTINDVAQTEKITDKTNSNGLVTVETVTLNAETLNTTDTYTISEVKIYESATSNTEDNSYIKLTTPITLSVTKYVNGDIFDVKDLRLSQTGKTTVTGTSQVTLTDVSLDDGTKVNITAKIDSNNVITVTIPNKDITGSYSMNLLKTTENFATPVKGISFKYTGNVSGAQTDNNGEISLVNSYTITKNNVNTIDTYEITEVENKKNVYLELADKITVKVEKALENDNYVVSKVSVTSGSNTQTISRGSGTNTVQLDNVKTVNTNRNTTVKLSLDESTQKITVYVDNPKIEGEYGLKIKKVDSVDSNKVLQGVTFSAVKDQTTITKTTQSDGYAYILGDDPYTSQTEEMEKMVNAVADRWLITEDSTIEGYELLKNIQISVTVPKKISDDGTKYVINADSVSISVERTAEDNETRARQSMILQLIQKSVSSDGTELTIVLPNEKITDYTFKLVKQDDSGNSVTGSKFTVIDSNGTTLLSEEELPNGSYFVKQYENVKANSTYKFTITENSSPVGYRNILDGFNLEVSVNIDSNGNVDVSNSEIEIVPINTNYNQSAYAELQGKIDSGEIGLSLEDDNTIAVTIENPIITTDFIFSLIKQEINSTKPISGVDFTVTYVTNNNTTQDFTTDSDGSFEIDNKENVNVSKKYEYIVEETSPSGSYKRTVRKAFVSVEVDEQGVSFAEITKIVLEGSTEEIDYDKNVHGKYVYIEHLENNQFTIKWYNSVQYQLVLLKRGYTQETSNLTSLPILNDAEFNVIEENSAISGSQVNITDTTNLGKGNTLYVNREAKTNSTYIYTINELVAATDYNNDFENVNVIVELKVDSKGQLIEYDKLSTGSTIYITPKEGVLLTSEQYNNLMKKLSLNIDTSSNTATVNIVDTPIVVEPDHYNLQLVKVDKNNKTQTIEGVTFQVKQYPENSIYDADTATSGIQNPVTDSNGIININNIEFEADATDRFVITELDAGSEYKPLEEIEINVDVNLTGLTEASQITKNNISVSLSGENATTIDVNDITYNVIDNNTVQIVIPNESINYQFVLNKVDSEGNLITADIDENGNIDSTILKMTKDGRTIMAEEPFKDGTKTFEQNGKTDRVYTYIITENTAKSGYKNILENCMLWVTVQIDENGIVRDENNGTSFTVKSYNPMYPVDTEVVKQYISLHVVDSNNDGVKEIVVNIENPVDYKLRLRKEDTNNNPLDKAVLTASLKQGDEYVEQCKLDRVSEGETSSVEIRGDETQEWIIKELSVDTPFDNILENREIRLATKFENGKLVYDYEIYEIAENGDETLFGKDNPIYELININLVLEKGEYVFDVEIQNPITYDFELIKTDTLGNEITSAMLKVNEITNVNGATYDSNISITEESMKVGNTKSYTISELKTEAPYVNVLNGKLLHIVARVNEQNKVDIVAKGYIDSEGYHSGFGLFSEFVDVKVTTDETTNKQTIKVILKNPIQYKVKLYKVDENGNKLPNADFQIGHNGTVISNNGADYIEYLVTSETASDSFTIKENSSASGYNNDLKNKRITFIVLTNNGKISIPYKHVVDVNKNTVETNFDSIKDYFTYVIKQSNETEDGIPVVEMTMENSTDYNLNVIKQTTAEVDYDGAELELYEVNADTNERTLISNNIVNDEKQASISLSDVHVLPNKTYTYVIKEVSTTAPHINILDDNKEIRLNVKLEKDETTGELTLVHNYDIYDKNGNVLANDPAREFINFAVTKDESGKYTINAYIKNPVEFKMKFTKTDTLGNAIPGKAIITINGVQNQGTADETYSNLKIGDTVEISIKETSVVSPFVNILKNGEIRLIARVMENEKVEVVGKLYFEDGGAPIYTIPSEISQYFSYEVVTGDDGIQTLDIKLKNPVEYKIKLTKQDMAGLGLTGADIEVQLDGVTYTNEGKDYFEIPVSKVDVGSVQTLYISENSSKDNYENVFEGKKIIALLRVNEDYTLNCIQLVMVGGQTPTNVPSKYFNINIDNMEQNSDEITANITMKNPIKYNFEVIKTDLSGNELSGEDLQLQVTRNTDETVGNEGKSSIKFTEKDLVPNTVNTYVIEELSTIAPHVNELKDKKLTVEVRVDEKGEILVQKFEVTDKDENVVANDYISYDKDAIDADGTRLVKIFVKNPISYKFKLIKTETPTKEETVTGVLAETLEGTLIQVDNVTNENESSEINMTVDNVKIGDTKTFIIKEISTTGAHVNLLENKEILLTTVMGTDTKLYFASEQLRDTTTQETIDITEEVKEQYRFDYEIVTDEDGYETVQVNIQNPIKFKVKVVKKDATGITELSGAELELKIGSEVVATNKETGSSTLEYIQENAGKNDTYSFTILENSSVSPNQNILNGKAIVAILYINDDEELEVRSVLQIDKNTGKFENVSDFIKVTPTVIDGIQTLVVEITNPVDYDIDLVKNAAGIGFLQNTKFQVYKEGTNESLFDGYVTDMNTWKTAEVTERNIEAGRYTYYITETKTARQRYINILDGKYIKVNAEVSGTGKVKIMNNNWEEDENYYEVYEGDIANRTSIDKLVDASDLIYDCITVDVLVNNSTGKNIIQCSVTNPIKYKVELEKVDSVGNSLQGAEFELVSQVVNEQNASKTEMDKTTGVDSITEDGVVSGITNENGNISYEETYVNVGTYEYTLKEIQTPGKQYVNPFKGCTIHFKVSVNKDGDIELVYYDNGKKCYIEKDGVEATEDLYDYIVLDTKNNTILATLQIEVENPVRYRFQLEKDIYGEENIYLSGVKFKIESSLIKHQGATKTQMSKTIGVDEVTPDGVISGTTNEHGTIAFEETMVRPGTYEYWISEIETGNKNILNGLQDTFIKIYVKVSSDGTIHTVTEDDQIIDGKFYLYDSTKENKIDFNTTSIDELINVYITEIDGLHLLHVAIDNPQKYDLNLYKTDIDTKENMNDVQFEIKAYKENELGGNEEITLRKAYDNTQGFDTKELLTSTVNSVNGVISLKDILFESAGTYYFEFIETTPKDPIIYKDKSENVKVKVEIVVEEVEGQRQYVIKNMEIVQGEKYTISENTNITDSTVNTNITNERIKGSYNLEITKLEELLGGPVQGSRFKIEAYKENSDGTEEQINLYKATDDVTSMEEIVPDTFTINSENGEFNIDNIKIENLDSYIIQITETEAPETYTMLRDQIRLKITPKIEGENDDARFVIDTIELISGDNDGLVKLENTEDKISLEITNNQFDLALRKYISSINGEDVSRWSEPEVNTSKLITGESTTAEYYNAKTPLRVYTNQEIIYTLRIYNEGQIDGFANEITDHLPEQLEFLPEDEFNTSREWKYDENDETLRTIKTNYLSKENGEAKIAKTDGEEAKENPNLIKAFNSETGEIDYVEIQVKCKVKPTAKIKQLITNIAEITEYEGKDRPDVVDRDSSKLVELPSDEDLPSYKQDEIEDKYVPGQEDDDDFEKVIVEEFDLSLRKFITKVNGEALDGEDSREPVVNSSKLISDESTTAEYNHTKDPVEVAHKNVVEYTIRVFNEGTVDGYANLVKDDIPAGLVFVPDDETNKEYGWKMLDENGNETNDVTKAKFIVTEYLSMKNGENLVSKADENVAENEENKSEESNKPETVNSNLIKAFDSNTMKTPDYRDVKAVFKVDATSKKEDIIINEAQISDDTDEFGKTVLDRDSSTDVWIEGEDDQDREYLKLVYFDLSLKKWVSQAIVYENGTEKIAETGYTGDENPEPVVKVDIGKNTVDTVVVKFKYEIKVTNEGIIPGYVKEISDYIPEGLRFEQSDNPTWKQVDGKVVTSEASDILLQPGESTSVTIVLTWNNSKDNLGLKVNTAEISEDYNNRGDTPDIDSTPNNHVPGEDDIDTAPVILAIRTGQKKVYIMLAISVTCFAIAGVIGVKKLFNKV